ncbi:MAG TPA: MerR family transcriptional regulator [Actinomycetota bacterium]|jgi:AcrR family transcriptional regulator|nr:MerR family transcriptional regulator [Actinomycetota bacterium]
MIQRGRFPIAELVRRTGVPSSSVHFYLREGLLPAPRRTARNRFLYDERHVQAVRLIRALRRRRRYPVPVIRRILPELLGMGESDAFRPEMWERAVDLRAARSGRPAPRERLVRAAIDAFSRAGYAEVNVDELCRAARIAKGSFYRLFRSKEELFTQAAEGAAAEIATAFRQARGTGPGTPEMLLASMEPRLAILLEVLRRAAQGREGAPSTAQRVLGTIATGIFGDGDDVDGTVLISSALALHVHRTASQVPPPVSTDVSRSL